MQTLTDVLCASINTGAGFLSAIVPVFSSASDVPRAILPEIPLFFGRNLMSELTTIAPGAATGPRTADGKARSSCNSTKIGLYTARDFIREGEEDEYIAGFNSLMGELDPQTPLEMIFATEIMSANWRLRRCRIIEADVALAAEPDDKSQRSVDRARAQSHNILRRSLADLRKLQTERAIRSQVKNAEDVPGLAETAKILRAAQASGQRGLRESSSASRQPAPSSFCKPAPAMPLSRSKTPRNAPCPCHSGRKFKRCCGNPAASNIKQAA
jgi:hypothetical protein